MIEKIKTLYWKVIDRNKKFGWFQEVEDGVYAGKSLAGDIKRSDITDKPFHNLKIVEKIHQKNTDMCVAAGKAYQKEMTEGVPMSWSGMFALYCKFRGTVIGYGASILGMMKACFQYGIPERSLWPFREDKGRDWNADWKNMPQTVIDNALTHKDGSYFEANRPIGWDRFDTFNAWLNKFQDKKLVIQTGTDAHNVTCEGFDFHPETKEFCMTALDSYGDESINYRIGRSINGVRYFNRKEANQLPTGYFSFDMPPALAELLNLYNEKAVKTKDSPDCFLVKNGTRHSLVNEEIAWSNNTLLHTPDNVIIISEDEMNTIPLGLPATFKEGKNWSIVQRILEKYAPNVLNDL